MSFNQNLEEIESLLEKARKRYVKETTEKFMEELLNNTYVLSEDEQREIESSHELTDEENNAFVQHLLEEGKRRCEVKLAKPIQLKEDSNNL